MSINGDVLHLVLEYLSLEFFPGEQQSENSFTRGIEVPPVHQRDPILPTKLHEIESTIESPRPERRHRMNLE